jgi:hypothetical protein
MPSGVGAIRAFLDGHGPDSVRSMLNSGGLPPQFNEIARRWLAEKEQEAEERDRWNEPDVPESRSGETRHSDGPHRRVANKR